MPLGCKETTDSCADEPTIRTMDRTRLHRWRQGHRPAGTMPALVASRFNPDLKAKYDQLKAAGKAPKVAITAIMRKLIVLANALLRKNRKWAQKPA